MLLECGSFIKHTFTAFPQTNQPFSCFIGHSWQWRDTTTIYSRNKLKFPGISKYKSLQTWVGTGKINGENF
jgi:urate oxidase